ncbi:MAG: YggS family pyridoxal phosphate-dependent enzyme [Bacteroides sp.]|nr:YggS family pyridoxal phosphate-dependent enzyme [Roseburia sp.]MCM1346637.1 YggS family pyridoxal phosphate-dependent enzyme [Bacteroides sp.]MCM1420036.1 YggS family pyridoxal phosphate-dependent enzyme [Bacteroides sp.]
MVGENLKNVIKDLDNGVRLVAVSKYHPVEELQEAYDAGQRIFGESQVQELTAKEKVLPKDIEWHFIGHLQTNKVKYIAPFVSLIHAVDSVRLLKEIDRQGAKVMRRIPCLLQVHIAREETKFGFAPDELYAMLDEGEWRRMEHVRIAGIMCMATNTDDDGQIRTEFCLAHQIFEKVKQTYFEEDNGFSELSMGMSHDYAIAMEEGSTLVRVGSKIFGDRDYSQKPGVS